MSSRINAFGPYLKKKFGTIVYKVNVDAGFTCPNRDGTVGTTGCIYCNNDSFRPSVCSPETSIRDQIRRGKSYLSMRYKAVKFLVYFQPFTNTYAPVAELERLYREALAEPSVIGLAIGTRPDCIDKEKIALLESLAKDHFILIEYGIQSIYDKSLDYILRGHDYRTFLDALKLTAGSGIHIGAHIIVGIPTETREEMIAMADELSTLPIEFLKIHQLQIVKDTVLARQYELQPFHTFEYEEYLDFLVDFIERLSPDIVLQRLFATAPDEILIAPQWGRKRHRIIRDIEERFEKAECRPGCKVHVRPAVIYPTCAADAFRVLQTRTNPCPCGYYGDSRHQCTCTPGMITRYRSKVSGPLMDRIDIHIDVPAVPYKELSKEYAGEKSESIRGRVSEARSRQLKRFSSDKIFANGQMKTRHMKKHCVLTTDAQGLLDTAMQRLGLSARAYSRILKVSRTVADLDTSDNIDSRHVAEAIQYRTFDRGQM